MAECTLCPRRCGADRSTSQGRCGAGSLPRLARAALHFWEEPCISGESGSGAVFFSGCPLGCCFCQNRPISVGNFGKEVSVERLAEIFLELQQQGAQNLNLVSAAQYTPQVLEAVSLVRSHLQIPVVWNSGGYECCETLKMLEGLVDIYLPDLKFCDPMLAKRYANAPDYFEVASVAILEMHRQRPLLQLDEAGMLQKGVIVRHLVMPGGREDSRRILHWLAENLPLESFYLSLMRQYTPDVQSPYKELRRPVASGEYRPLAELAAELGFQGYTQDRASSKKEYTPSFDLTGI